MFRRGYFCYGGGGVFLSGGVQSVRFGGGTSAVEEGVFLNWRGYSTIYVLEGMWEEIKKVWFELWIMYHE